MEREYYYSQFENQCSHPFRHLQLYRRAKECITMALQLRNKAAEINNIPNPILLNYWKQRISAVLRIETRRSDTREALFMTFLPHIHANKLYAKEQRDNYIKRKAPPYFINKHNRNDVQEEPNYQFTAWQWMSGQVAREIPQQTKRNTMVTRSDSVCASLKQCLMKQSKLIKYLYITSDKSSINNAKATSTLLYWS